MLATATTQCASEAVSTAWSTAEIMMVLTGFIALLTIVVTVCTIAVMVYAARTLKVTRESFEFFAKPVVRFGEQVTTWRNWRPYDPNVGGIAHFDVVLLNESADSICIAKGGMQAHIVEDKSSEYAAQLDAQESWVHMRLDGAHVQSWPMIVHRQYATRFLFRPRPGASDPEGKFDATIEITADYSYRGRKHKEQTRYCFEVYPPNEKPSQA